MARQAKHPKSEFAAAVETIVAAIPRGRLMSYGQIAGLLGLPRAAQAVGWTLHWSAADLPWQRVVNREGRLAPGCPGGMPAHAELLRAEGLDISGDWTVDLDRYRWEPPDALLRQIDLPAGTAARRY